MNHPRKFINAAILFWSFLTLVAVPAQAYADPNTVGLLSQVLTPLLITAGACVTFLRKSLIASIARVWRRLRGRADARNT
jgi:hypothetical protein